MSHFLYQITCYRYLNLLLMTVSTFYSTIAIAFRDKEPYSGDTSEQMPNSPAPTVSMKLFESELKPYSIAEDRALKSINGWLSPEGVLFGCRWREHSNAMKLLGFEHESEIETSGWIKLSQMRWMIIRRYADCNISEQQYDTIRHWHDSNFLSIDLFMFYKERMTNIQPVSLSNNKTESD